MQMQLQGSPGDRRTCDSSSVTQSEATATRHVTDTPVCEEQPRTPVCQSHECPSSLRRPAFIMVVVEALQFPKNNFPAKVTDKPHL